MKLFEIIESSKTWICPKTGLWKVICVGGGASPDGADTNWTAQGFAGGATSFGTILTANGGAKDGDLGITRGKVMLGYSIFCPDLYGTEYGGIRKGSYGAAQSHAQGSFFKGIPQCGDFKMTIVDIAEGTAVNCTVGKYTPMITSEEYPSYYGMPEGTDGAIILQYMGEV